MCHKTLFCIAACSLAIAIAASAQAADVAMHQQNAAGATAAPPTRMIDRLEAAMADLLVEFGVPAGSVPTAGQATQVKQPVAPVALQTGRTQPWSERYRTITTVVQFSRLRYPNDNGPDLWYTQGMFIDPTDGKAYTFLFDDMGALAISHGEQCECVVVYRPADRELNESDVAAIIPVDWVKNGQRQ